MGEIRVVLADDQDLVRDGFTMIIDSQPDMCVVGSASDGAEAVGLVRRHHPDVVLMDVRMPGLDGLAAARAVLSGIQPPKVLVLTTFDLDEYVVEALRLGAGGFLLKDSPRQLLLSAIRRVVEGELVVAPQVMGRLVDTFVDVGARREDPRVATLTEREVDVVRLVAQGLSNAEIADQLYLGVTTVKSHVARVLTKLGLRDRLQVAVFAHEAGLANRTH
jgi:DNA-binding NarL/FixJ family response regulator